MAFLLVEITMINGIFTTRNYIAQFSAKVWGFWPIFSVSLKLFLLVLIIFHLLATSDLVIGVIYLPPTHSNKLFGASFLSL
jgi:hypothetical protein